MEIKGFSQCIAANKQQACGLAAVASCGMDDACEFFVCILVLLLLVTATLRLLVAATLRLLVAATLWYVMVYVLGDVWGAFRFLGCFNGPVIPGFIRLTGKRRIYIYKTINKRALYSL